MIDRSGGAPGGAGSGRPGAAAAAEAPATPPGARGDGSGPCSSCALRVLGKSESGDSRTADTAPPDDASRPAPGHPGRPAATGSPAWTARRRARRTRGDPTDRVHVHTRPAAGARVRLPFFSGDLLEHVDLQISIGHHLFQPAVLLLELAAAASHRRAPTCRSVSARRRASGR